MTHEIGQVLGPQYGLRSYMEAFEPIRSDHVASRVDMINDGVSVIVTRGAYVDRHNRLRQPTSLETPDLPSSGLVQAGHDRVTIINLAVKLGIIDPRLFITTSGDCPLDLHMDRVGGVLEANSFRTTQGKGLIRPLTETELNTQIKPVPDNHHRVVVHYGNVAARQLQDFGLNQRSDGSERPIYTQEWSDDTLGEAAFMPQHMREEAQDPSFATHLAEAGGSVTVVSSAEQLPRLQLARLFTLFQDPSPQSQEEARLQTLEWRNKTKINPAVLYFSMHRDAITQMAIEGTLDQTQVAKVLYFIDQLNTEDESEGSLFSPENMKVSSDTLFSHPRFAGIADRALPTLSEDLQWMRNSGIQINDIMVEEIAIAIQKSLEADPDPKRQRVGSILIEKWLARIYHDEPAKNPLLKTIIRELEGPLDQLKSMYYAQGERKNEKLQFEADIRSAYFPN